jgi:outer membrane protein TolC
MFRKTLILLLITVAITLSAMTWAADGSQPQSPVEVLTLEQCLDLAYQNSPSLKVAQKNLEIAQAQLRQAQGSFLPTVNYSITEMKSNDPLASTNFKSNEYSTGTLSITEKLYTGGMLTARLEMAKYGLDTALEEQRKSKLQLAFNVKQAYYQFWLAQQMLEVSKSSYKNAERRYQQQKAFYEVGNSSKVELLQAQVQWESLKPQIINSQNALDAAKLNLAIILGIGKDRPFTINVDPSKLEFPENVTIFFETTLENAYKNRPDMRQMKNSIEISKLNTKMVTAGYKPIISLSASSQGGSSDLNPANWKNGSWFTLTFNLSGVLFDGLATQAKVSEAQKNEELMAIRGSSLKDQVQVEIELAIQNLNANLAAARASQANITLAKESLRLIQAKYDAGMATTMDITDAQLKLDQALNGYYSGLSAYLTALAKLDLVTGTEI